MTPEEIEKKWKTFESLLKRLSDDNILNLIDSIGQRIIMSPASQRSDQYGAYPGGLVEHSLNVASFLRNANEVYNHGLDMNSIIKVSLLHDIGKIGDLENDLFLVQDSDWHREKLNQEYKYNENISKMSVIEKRMEEAFKEAEILMTSDKKKIASALKEIYSESDNRNEEAKSILNKLFSRLKVN